MKRIFISAFLAIILSAVVAFGQGSSVRSTPTNSGEHGRGEGKRWSFWVSLAAVGDSNINQDDSDVADYGGIASAGIYFRNRAKRPNFEISYEIGRHEYAVTSRWDRTSHAVRARSENRLGKKWVSTTRGEATFKGTTEDRELTNRFAVMQFFQYRLTKNDRVNIGGAYRIRRYEEVSRLRNSTNPYLEGGYERHFDEGKRKVEFSYRYEENRARSDNFSYIRWTYGAQLETKLTKKGRLDLELRYRPQKYSRLIDIDLPDGSDIEVPRRDTRWIFGADWRRPIWQGLELGVIYKFENRRSNDMDKNFKAHNGGVVLTYRWWK